jgi:hypothetical protein
MRMGWSGGDDERIAAVMMGTSSGMGSPDPLRINTSVIPR